MDLKDLPLFTIEAVRWQGDQPEAVIQGHLSHLTGVRNAGGTLYRANSRSVIGTVERLPTRAGERFELTTADVERIAELTVGDTYPWIDYAWNAYHVDLILAGDWHSREFVATPAERFKAGNVIGWQPIGLPLPDGALSLGIHEGGWDHEHCLICNAHIGAGGDAQAYSDPDDHWLCNACYSRYVVPKDISFLAEV